MRVREGKLLRYTERSHRGLRRLWKEFDAEDRLFLIVAARYFDPEILSAGMLH